MYGSDETEIITSLATQGCQLVACLKNSFDSERHHYEIKKQQQSNKHHYYKKNDSNNNNNWIQTSPSDLNWEKE
jgi:hypothetical protein